VGIPSAITLWLIYQEATKIMDRKIKVVIAKLGLDIHWRGVYLVAQYLKEAGMDVVYLGNKFPAEIVEAAIEEDADVVGLSSLCGNHLALGPMVVDMLKEKGLNNVKVFLGGVIPLDHAKRLEGIYGIHRVYLPETPMQTIVDEISESVRDAA
jgi:methylmalonyl-CoA mutase C-terminal domain/subunit|tara:strand:- start:471 stop:929 length:459 start_codon:yes stop_codon:yes gene_type:complete